MKKETKSKDAPKEHKQPWQEKDGDAIYSQAYALYQQGFQYWFSPNEIRKMAQRGYIAVHRSGLEMEAQRGYIAVHRSGLEMEEYRRKLADEAMTDDSMTAGF